jgi:hypothetical protein
LLASADGEVQERASGRDEPIFDKIGCQERPAKTLPRLDERGLNAADKRGSSWHV